jgi:uncharacterized membrane protein HdeD (DUF308 family)
MAAVATVRAPGTRWWFPLILGVLAILVGISFLANPALTSVGFVFGLGIYWIAAGVLDLVQIFQDQTLWGWRLFTGILGILAGAWILSGILGKDHPLGTAFAVGSAFTWLLGFMGLVYGVIAIVGAFQGGGWAPGVLGAIGILTGLVLLVNTISATLALPLSLAVVLIIGGIGLIVAAFRSR